jgi:co-chaperonin GroES (HSP10)
MKLKPLGDKVVVEVIDEPQTTASGIVLPDSAKEKSQRGKVVAVGSGKLLDNGSASRSRSRSATPSSSPSTAAPRSTWTAKTS